MRDFDGKGWDGITLACEYNQPIEFYRDLMLSLYELDDERERCWALENMWHTVFGEPFIIPFDASMVHIPESGHTEIYDKY